MRLIDADKLLKSSGYRERDLSIGAEYIISAPTVDAVPVVRCKDCKNYMLCGGNTPKSKNNWCIVFSEYVNPNDFCSRGERAPQ